MNLLITVANGFLGRRITAHFDELNYKIATLGRQEANNIRFDLTSKLEFKINDYFDLVIHAAGKAHIVPKTKLEIQDFYDVNVRGTINLLNALENNVPKSFIFISSVSVYGLDKGKLINENFPLSAQDPYGKSKIEAEKIILDWCERNNVICTILRLPLLIGPNPPGNLAAMIRGIEKGYYFNIGTGDAKKSMVMVEDVIKILPKVAEIGGIYNLTDGIHPTFSQLSLIISNQFGRKKPLNIPLWLAKIMAGVGDVIGKKSPINSNKLIKITSVLTFDDAKAREIINWKPRSVLDFFKVKS